MSTRTVLVTGAGIGSLIHDFDTTIIVGGREHTERQFGTLLDRSGFRITRVSTVSTTSLNEAVAGR